VRGRSGDLCPQAGNYAKVKRKQITDEGFETLLSWLSADRDQAGEKYEAIRQKLVRLFVSRGCADAEGLADETINRVTLKLSAIMDGYTGDPTPYFYGVARMVHLEYLRTSPRTDQPTPHQVAPFSSSPEEGEEQFKYEALSDCLELLEARDRELVLEYYISEGLERHKRRMRLAEAHKVTLTSLRQRVHRIRRQLEKCVKEKLFRLDE
jgi:DNA-directed RNA polymerase specialized sigma24 family protein